jgi:hypothetical protein
VTGDFIAFSLSDPVLVEVMAGFAVSRGIKGAFCFRLAVSKPIGGGVLTQPRGAPASRPKIQNIPHYRSRIS